MQNSTPSNPIDNPIKPTNIINLLGGVPHTLHETEFCTIQTTCGACDLQDSKGCLVIREACLETANTFWLETPNANANPKCSDCWVQDCDAKPASDQCNFRGINTLIVALQGKPKAGKDYLANAVASANPHAVLIVSSSEYLKKATHKHYNLPYATPYDAYELVKDTKQEDLGGLTPREAYIKQSKKLKAKLGDDYFGVATSRIVQRRLRHRHKLVIITGVGFQGEYDVMQERHRGRIKLVTIENSKELNATGDSRSLLQTPHRFTNHHDDASVEAFINYIGEL